MCLEPSAASNRLEKLFPDLAGAVAQLGEHLLCKQGVTGSIPVSSTTLGLQFAAINMGL